MKFSSAHLILFSCVSSLGLLACNTGQPLGPCEQKFERSAYVYNHTGAPLELDVDFGHTKDDGSPMPSRLPLTASAERQRVLVDQGSTMIYPPGKLLPTSQAKCTDTPNSEISSFEVPLATFDAYLLCEMSDLLNEVYSSETFPVSTEVLHVYPKSVLNCPPPQRPARRPAN